jgi:medium-chain acyl-[acyl-carrier-protein] hydrolase
MDATTLDRWVPFRSEGTVVRCRLFCFPHAAGNAALYRPLRSFMPAEIDLCPVELPGRAARLGEPPFTSMSALMERLHHALQPLMAVPFGFFGHSVGACVAFEAARRLRAIDGRAAIHLFVSARAGPHTSPPPARLRTDHELLGMLGRFGGTPEAIMQRPELVAAILPTLRADIALAERHTVDAGDRIGCPITAFGGADDVSLSGSLRSWSDFTRARFRTCIFPGGHFYFASEGGMLADEITKDLHTSMGLRAMPASSTT